MKKEHGILYSPAMVKAKLSGRKTVTRRIITPHNCVTSIAKKYLDWDHDNIFINGDLGIKLLNKQDGTLWRASCKWQPGDLMWVRETWCRSLDEEGSFLYRATEPDAECEDGDGSPWKPSIHMPKVAARIWDEVVSVRAERLQDITEEDAIAEGIEPDVTGICNGLYGTTYQGYYNYAKEGYRYVDALTSYRSLWESINGPGSWENNPLVWRIETKPYRK